MVTSTTAKGVAEMHATLHIIQLQGSLHTQRSMLAQHAASGGGVVHMGGATVALGAGISQSRNNDQAHA
jgi:hypothetical protein